MGADWMDKKWKVITVLAIVLAVAGLIALKQAGKASDAARRNLSLERSGTSLPHLIDLGADQCIPCKMMAPILEELRKEYKGRLEVTFIDVWKDPAPGRKYGIRAIPTQIFLTPDGQELFRHEGFLSKVDILAKWRELGFDLEG